MTYIWDNGLRSGSRSPELFLVRGGEAFKFSGDHIPGICAVTTQSYEKNGKWSSTEFTLELGAGVKAIEVCKRLHQIAWAEHCSSWRDLAEELNVPIGVARQIAEYYPATLERLDTIERLREEFEDQNDREAFPEVFEFGGPSNKERDAGFWVSPKTFSLDCGVEVTLELINPEKGWEVGNVQTSHGKVVSVRHSPGYHGGYVTVDVLI